MFPHVQTWLQAESLFHGSAGRGDFDVVRSDAAGDFAGVTSARRLLSRSFRLRSIAPVAPCSSARKLVKSSPPRGPGPAEARRSRGSAPVAVQNGPFTQCVLTRLADTRPRVAPAFCQDHNEPSEHAGLAPSGRPPPEHIRHYGRDPEAGSCLSRPPQRLALDEGSRRADPLPRGELSLGNTPPVGTAAGSRGAGTSENTARRTSRSGADLDAPPPRFRLGLSTNLAGDLQEWRPRARLAPLGRPPPRPAQLAAAPFDHIGPCLLGLQLTNGRAGEHVPASTKARGFPSSWQRPDRAESKTSLRPKS